jgi:hypothetical protein
LLNGLYLVSDVSHFLTFFVFCQVKQITRDFQVVDGELSYFVQMATNTTSLQPHLKALLKKI